MICHLIYCFSPFCVPLRSRDVDGEYMCLYGVVEMLMENICVYMVSCTVENYSKADII